MCWGQCCQGVSGVLCLLMKDGGLAGFLGSLMSLCIPNVPGQNLVKTMASLGIAHSITFITRNLPREGLRS